MGYGKSSFLSACMLAAIGCGGSDAIRDPELDRWCGDSPCDWMVQGDVERVGSWHTNDYALQLVGDDAQLSQVNGVLQESTNCLDFSLVAKIDRGVRVFLELDFMNDGTVEFSQQLPVSDWDRLTFKVTPPTWYRGVTFSIRKDGPGRAIVAELAASRAWGACTAPPIELSDRPFGARCTSGDDCASGSCVKTMTSGGQCE